MNVLFLDYDGVVNTPMWDDQGTHFCFGFPEDEKVNNFQCVQWVSEFCEKHDFVIVVTSTWRYLTPLYKECLINGGLREGIQIVGCTDADSGGNRELEIAAYLELHEEIKKYLIFDDYDDFEILNDHVVHCETDLGFNISKFDEAEELYEKLYGKKN